MADYKSAVKKAEQTNRKRRKESGVELRSAREKMSSFLFREVKPLDNLLLDGNDEDRYAALYRWLEQLYASGDVADCPVIVTGPRNLDNVMNELAKNGMSIIMISSELPEIINMSDRVYVMYEGNVTGCLDHKDVTQESIMQRAALSE